VDAPPALVEALAGRVPLLGLAGGGEAAGLELQRTAARCAGALLDAGYSRVHLAGSDAGALLACEVARHVDESGGETLGLTAIGGVPPEGAEAYAGDLTLVRPRSAAGSAGDEMAERWRSVCLGEVRVVDVDVDDAAALAAVLVPAGVTRR
jgi:hypothetical protein